LEILCEILIVQNLGSKSRYAFCRSEGNCSVLVAAAYFWGVILLLWGKSNFCGIFPKL